jgi:hypothetical protein
VILPFITKVGIAHLFKLTLKILNKYFLRSTPQENCQVQPLPLNQALIRELQAHRQFSHVITQTGSFLRYSDLPSAM